MRGRPAYRPAARRLRAGRVARVLAALTLRAGTDAAVELRWSASRSTAVKAPCEHDAKTSYTHARAGSRSAVDKLAIVAEPYLAIALAPDAKLQHLRAVQQCASRRRVTRSVDVARSSGLKRDRAPGGLRCRDSP